MSKKIQKFEKAFCVIKIQISCDFIYITKFDILNRRLRNNL